MAQPLLAEAKETQDENVEDNDDNEENTKECHKPATSLAAAYRLLTPSVKVSSSPLESDLLLLASHASDLHTYIWSSRYIRFSY